MSSPSSELEPVIAGQVDVLQKQILKKAAEAAAAATTEKKSSEEDGEEDNKKTQQQAQQQQFGDKAVLGEDPQQVKSLWMLDVFDSHGKTPKELLDQAESAKGAGNNCMAKAQQSSELGQTREFLSSAITCYTRGLSLCAPDLNVNSQLYCNRAAAYLMLTDFQRALRDAQRAIVINGKYTKAYHRAIRAAINLSQHNVARELCQQAIDIAGSDEYMAAGFKGMLRECDDAQRAASLKPMKVTLVSGFLGSGKTSLLTHILTNKEQKMKCAVIVNEISEFNVDAMSVEGANILQGEEKMVEMSNGCICCTLREDLLQQLTELQRDGYDACLIEASGIAEPLQTAETFFFFQFKTSASSKPQMLQDVAPLDNCVTVVDAGRLIEQMTSLEKSKKNEDSKDISNLLFDQLEFANVVLLNKIDLIQKAVEYGHNNNNNNADSGKNSSSSTTVTVQSLTDLIKKINPQCEVIPTKNSIVPLEKIVNTSNFSIAFAQRRADWMEDIKEGGLKHVPETEEYGVSSMSFTVNTPFHPQKLHDWLNKYSVVEEIKKPQHQHAPGEEHKHDHDHNHASDGDKKKELSPAEEEQEREARAKKAAVANEKNEQRTSRYGNLFRGKGFAWIANPRRYQTYAAWGQAGGLLTILPEAGLWEHFTKKKPNDPSSAVAGQKLIFIGQDLKKDVLRADLSELLLTHEEQTHLLKVSLAATLKKTLQSEEDLFDDPFGKEEKKQS